MYDKK